MKPTLGILGSGKGSNLEAIYHAIGQRKLEAEIKIVISDVKESGFLQKAKRFNLPEFWLESEGFECKALALLQKYQVDLVILAGFRRILSASFLKVFPNRILNLHPSLLPKYPGKKAWEKALENKDKETGCTVHLVTEHIDQGQILGQRKVSILPGDTAESLYKRIQDQEHQLYADVIKQYWRNFNS